MEDIKDLSYLMELTENNLSAMERVTGVTRQTLAGWIKHPKLILIRKVSDNPLRFDTHPLHNYKKRLEDLAK